MSYQVLARKWRPQNFKQMVGQEHVLRALIHALENQRLHHAYLFTGTRGVGKTTIGRILAKCLSCEKGITAEPCGQCGACQSIAEGRYVDLIEIDAASRTKVEDMRELLDNVPYAPTEGRYKIYLIDEVHMLSTSSFNALLKTLEEPPEHVKFLFATTDPQKLPVTILSRCLQFNLKNMSPDRIVGYLKMVLEKEAVEVEESALWALARAADGSMRDALSLTDQAIAYGNGSLKEQEVSAMLGTVDQNKVYRILEAVIGNDAETALNEIAALAEYSPDYAAVLASLSSILHRIAIAQWVPGAIDNTMGDEEKLKSVAAKICAEDAQLFYQISLVSRKDLQIAPDQRAAFEMAVLRMMAFQLNAPSTGAEKTGPEDRQIEAVDTESGANDEIKSEAPPRSEEENRPSIAPVPSNSSELSSSERSASSAPSDSSVTADAMPAPEGNEQIDVPPVDAYGDLDSIQTEDDSIDVHDVIGDDPVKKQNSQSQESKKKTEVDSNPLYNSESQIVEPQIVEPQIVDQQNVEPQNVDLHVIEDAPSEDKGSAQHQVSAEVATAEVPIDHGENHWPTQASNLGLSGMTQNLILNSTIEHRGEEVVVGMDSGHHRLLTDVHQNRIIAAIQEFFNTDKPVTFAGEILAGAETPMMWRKRIEEEAREIARQKIQSDPNIHSLIQRFDAKLLESSIEPVGKLY